MKEKRKIIIVGAHALGRTGTSAMMGLIRIFGANVGGHKTGLGRKSSTNKKGHLEIPAYKDFLGSAFKDFYPTLNSVPTPDMLNKLVTPAVRKAFRSLIFEEFGRKYPIVIKDARLMGVYLFKHMKNVDIRCIVLNRNLQDQVKSTVNKNHREYTPENINYFKSRILEWQKFTKATVAAHKGVVKFVPISFDALIYTPETVSLALSKFLEIPCPDVKKVQQWIDPKLTHTSK